MAIVMKMILFSDRAFIDLRAAFDAPVPHFFVQNADADAARGDHLAEARGVVLGPAFQRNKQDLALEANPPMQISGVIAQFDRIAYRTRLDRAWSPAAGGAPDRLRGY